MMYDACNLIVKVAMGCCAELATVHTVKNLYLQLKKLHAIPSFFEVLGVTRPYSNSPSPQNTKYSAWPPINEDPTNI